MVCSNSFRSDDHEQNAVGLLHWEMLKADGLIIHKAYEHRLPAGGALAVDRSAFSKTVTETLKAHPNITVVYEEITTLPASEHWILATGPLTSSSLGQSIAEKPAKTRWPFSMQLRRSFIMTALICPKRGCNRAMIRARPKKNAKLISTAQ